MSSFKAMRELTLLSYAENLLSDDEFLVLWEDNQSKNPDFTWDSPFDAECNRVSSRKKEIFTHLERFWTFHQLLGASKRVYAKAWKDFVCY